MKKLFAITFALFIILFFACDEGNELNSRPLDYYYMEIYSSDGRNLLDAEVEGNLLGSRIQYKFEHQSRSYTVKWEKPTGNEIFQEDTWQMFLDDEAPLILVTYGDPGLDESFAFTVYINSIEYNIAVKHFAVKNKADGCAQVTINGRDVDAVNDTRSHTFRLTIPAEK